LGAGIIGPRFLKIIQIPTNLLERFNGDPVDIADVGMAAGRLNPDG
jgi:hypothetical protein